MLNRREGKSTEITGEKFLQPFEKRNNSNECD